MSARCSESQTGRGVAFGAVHCRSTWCVTREVQAQPDTDSECELAKAEILKWLGKGEAGEGLGRSRASCFAGHDI